MSTHAAYLDVQGLSVDVLVERHAELVKRIAYHLAGRLPASVDVNDLIQAGMIGLIEAARNYVRSRGANFETYAGIRIRGAMLDEVRRSDWTPRSVHRKAREIAAAVRAIEHETGRDARDTEIAEHLNMSLQHYHKILSDTANCRLFSLDEGGPGHGEDAHDIAEANNPGPFQNLAESGLRQALAAAIDNLPERERLVMSLYYDQELNLKEIGAVLEVSESRICQIHGQALVRLRARLTAWTSVSSEA